MPLTLLTLLALIQGITEFLPISSSGHLILFPALTGAQDQGLAIDVAVHVGTLAAVLLYFRGDFADVFTGALRVARGDLHSGPSRLALMLTAATVPVLIAGVTLSALDLTDGLRSVEVIAWATILWGVALYVADRFPPERRTHHDWRWRDVAAMGLAQAFAIIPGTSRSGVTMTAARALGFTRVDSARLSMLMSAPAIGAAGAWLIVKMIRDGDAAVGTDAAIAATLAFLSAYVALWALMRMLTRFSMTPFVIYRMVLGAGLLWVAYG
jgi:undecaprenyl-diphosphatase